MNRLACLVSFLCALFVAQFAIAQDTYVVIAVIDGARYSETFGDTEHAYIPHIWNELRPLGIIYTSYYNEGRTETNPGHSTILTGTWQNIANDGSQRPTNPTVFEYYRKQTGAPQSANYVLLGKTKLGILSYSTHPEYGAGYGAAVQNSSSQYNDVAAFAQVKNMLAAHHPYISIINFPQTDNAGHSGVWANYLTALRGADSLVYELWNFIQADSLMGGHTTLIVTNDHGRHLDGVSGGFASHGDGCDGCRHIMLFIAGPQTPQGIVDTTRTRQIDIAPTVGALLGFSTPLSIGNLLHSAIVTSVRSEYSLLPHSFELEQNFPNPFNPTTTLSFAISSWSFVSLEVYDAAGRETAVLVREDLAPGQYERSWDASIHASGVYYYRLTTSSGTIVKKMTLMK